MPLIRNASVRPAKADRLETEKENHVRQPFSNAVPSQSRRVHSANSSVASATASTRAALPESKAELKTRPPQFTLSRAAIFFTAVPIKQACLARRLSSSGGKDVSVQAF